MMANIQERSRTRRQRLLDAALEVFTQYGYNDTAIDEIARASETSKGGLYFHFPSKQALFLALLDEASEALLRRVESAMANEADPLERGDAALREVLHAFGSHRLLARLLLVEALGAGKEFTTRLNDLHAAFAALIADCLDAAVRAGQIPPLDARVAAHAWYGAVNQVVLRWLMTGEPQRLEETYPALRSLLLFGVTGACEERRP
jgi:TetR/AcrR family transcriptional regulator, fatty acid metabolism regulator protein